MASNGGDNICRISSPEQTRLPNISNSDSTESESVEVLGLSSTKLKSLCVSGL